jgi:hypothetical protein
VPIDSKYHQLSIDAKSASSYKKTMEKKNDSPSVAKKAAPTTKMIAALVSLGGLLLSIISNGCFLYPLVVLLLSLQGCRL